MINTSYIFEALINNFDKGKVDLLSLKPGQIIRGNVLQIFDGGHALVSIKGTNVIAKSEVPLTKGQQSMFLVTSTDEDIKLKILNEGKSLNTPTAITKEIFKYLDLKNTPTNKQIVEGFIKENLPVDKSIVKTISSLVDQGYELKNLLSAAKILSDKRLPIATTNLKVVTQFFNDEGIADKLIKLSDSITNNKNINNLPNEVNKLLIKTEGQVSKLLFEIKAYINPSLDLYINNNIKSNPNTNTNTNINNNLGLKSNSNINPSINNDSRMSSKVTNSANQSTIVNSNVIESKSILHKITSFMEEMQLKPFESIRIDSVSLKESLEQLYKYKELLPKSIANNLERTVQHITGQHLINQPDISQFNQIIYQFPSFVPFSDKPVFMKIHNNKQDGSRSLDPNDVNLAFLFQLNNLGDLVIKVKINDNQMFIQFMNNNPTTKEILKQFEPSFVQFLHAQGYRTSGFTFHPLLETRQDTFTESTSTYKGVDIRL